VKSKVLLDSNVLIAASVYANVKQLEVPFKHDFFDQATNLIGIIKKHIGKRIGIVTPTIESEVHGTLAKAVTKTLRQFLDGDSRKQTFDLLSHVLNKCEDRLAKILLFVVREAIPPSEKGKWLPKVEDMYKDLLEQANSLDIGAIARSRSEGSSPRYKKTAYKLIRKDVAMQNRQLLRLRKKSAEPTDKEIIAEAAYLSQHYREIGPYKLFLSSCDLAISPQGSSRIVTDEILKRFRVECDWPAAVAKKLLQELKEH